MGRITIFTSHDILSWRVKSVLDALSLPYHEINLSDHPQYQASLESLALTSSVPQVFFNTRHVGGYKETLKELYKWNTQGSQVSSKSKVVTPLERYRAEVEAMSEPQGFPCITARDIQQFAVKRTLEKHLSDPCKRPLFLRWPDASSWMSVGELTERLELCLPLQQHFYKGVTYKKSFLGHELVQVLENLMRGSDLEMAKCDTLAQKLLDLQVILPANASVASPGSTKFNDSRLYRLHCHATPDVVNSFCSFKSKYLEGAASRPSRQNAQGMVLRMHDLLNEIERDCLNRKGKIDYTRAYLHPAFTDLECVASELQVIDFVGNCNVNPGFDKEGLALGLNVYHIMLRLSLYKLGIPTNDVDKRHFLENVRFNLGGKLYSFNQFLHVLLRLSDEKNSSVGGNSINLRSFCKLNRSSSDHDARVHFAVNQGLHMGCQASLPFGLYSAGKLDQQLDMSGRVLCSQSKICKVRNHGKVKLATFMRDNRRDLGRSNEGLLRLLAQTVAPQNRASIDNALLHLRSVKFVEVDWSTHAVNYAEYKRELVVGQFKGIQAFVSRFQPAPHTPDEKVRLRTLYSFGLLDTLPEDRFDTITAQCQKELKMPVVIANLVDRNRQWFKSIQWKCPGDAPPETPREIAFCGHTILLNGKDSDNMMLYVENTLNDDRFADNPLVTGPLNVRFYAGVPIVVPSTGGRPTNIGTLCIVDQKPRQLTMKQKHRLIHYAKQVQSVIMRRDKHQSLDDSFRDLSMSSTTQMDEVSPTEHFP